MDLTFDAVDTKHLVAIRFLHISPLCSLQNIRRFSHDTIRFLHICTSCPIDVPRKSQGGPEQTRRKNNLQCMRRDADAR